MYQQNEQRKRRRIVINDDDDDVDPINNMDDDDDLGSNPDERLDELPPSDDEEGEDLMGENWLDDYVAAPELDNYDANMLDDAVIEESYEKRIRDRLAAEEELDAMDAKRRQREMEQDYNLERVNRFEQQEIDEDEELEEENLDEGADRPLNLEQFECPLREWIAEERTRREIKRRFRIFLSTYFDDIEKVEEFRRHNGSAPLPPHLVVKRPIYPLKIRTMCTNNSASLEVSYQHLAKVQSLLAIWLTDVPREMLQIFDEVLQSVVLQSIPNYSKIAHEMHVRIIELPLSDKLRDLRQGDLNNLVRVSGVVTRRTGVFPQLLSIAYDCVNCGVTLGPFKVVGADGRPTNCPNCNDKRFTINTHKTQYGNYQKLTLQETPGTVPAGRVPRYKDVILLGDLIDVARPGEEVEVTGIYSHTQQMSRKSNGFPVFTTIIEANCVQKKQGGSSAMWTNEEKKKIKDLANDPQIGERIIRSIAPSIYGHRHVKTALALSLFGGCQKDGAGVGMHRVRGDINVLLLGDPGTAKSQFLKYSEKVAPRSVYTTGKGASAVGLTAGVHKDPMTKEWTLEGGALVLADQGVCLIDEFDKMNEQDRTSIHEAMEQQTISVSKAGIVTSLQARCSVIAAANPIGGRYDPSFSFAENVELTDPILQRFDILCVLQDVVDPIADERLAMFVANSHIKSHPLYNGEELGGLPTRDTDEQNADHNLQNEIDMGRNGFDNRLIGMDGPPPIEQALLKKYIAYARSQVKPILHDVDSEKISQLYAELRSQSAVTGGVPIAVRHLESIVRMSEASARMHLRDHVRRDDVDLAIKVVLESFLQAQKVSVRKTLQRSFRKYVTYGEDCNLLLMHQLQNLFADMERYNTLTRNTNNFTEVYIEALESRAKELKIFDLKPFFQSGIFRSHNLQVDFAKGVIKRVFAVVS